MVSPVDPEQTPATGILTLVRPEIGDSQWSSSNLGPNSCDSPCAAHDIHTYQVSSIRLESQAFEFHVKLSSTVVIISAFLSVIGHYNENDCLSSPSLMLEEARDFLI